jgi:hypothetical protein
LPCWHRSGCQTLNRTSQLRAPECMADLWGHIYLIDGKPTNKVCKSERVGEKINCRCVAPSPPILRPAPYLRAFKSCHFIIYV